MPIKQAVIVAGGLGTRFLPASLTIPKEMLPIVDRPAIQYVVEEAIASGIEHVVLLSSQGKGVMEDYFDLHLEMERNLQEKGDDARYQEVARVGRMIDVVIARQKEQLGLGHAILSAEPALKSEPFAAILPDDIISGEPPALREMIEAYERYPGAYVAVERVADDAIPSYGIIDPEPVENRLSRVKRMVEKPPLDQAPSNLGIVGRYILPYEIFDIIRAAKPGAKGEIQITDAIDALRAQGTPIYGYEFRGARHDVGNPLGAIKASLAFALDDPDLGPALRQYIADLIG